MRLELVNASARVEGRDVLHEVSFSVGERDLIGVVGSNGSGKTTLLNALSRLIPLSSGSLLLDGSDCARLHAEGMARRGVARLLQRRTVVPELSALDNVMLASRNLSSLTQHLFGGINKEVRSRALRSLAEMRFGADVDSPVGLGRPFESRQIELARARIAAPKIVLLDEPFAGLSLHERANLQSVLQEWHTTGVGIVIVEHHHSNLDRWVHRLITMDDGNLLRD